MLAGAGEELDHRERRSDSMVVFGNTRKGESAVGRLSCRARASRTVLYEKTCAFNSRRMRKGIAHSDPCEQTDSQTAFARVIRGARCCGRSFQQGAVHHRLHSATRVVLTTPNRPFNTGAKRKALDPCELRALLRDAPSKPCTRYGRRRIADAAGPSDPITPSMLGR